MKCMGRVRKTSYVGTKIGTLFEIYITLNNTYCNFTFRLAYLPFYTYWS